jgi:hypothetical protein
MISGEAMATDDGKERYTEGYPVELAEAEEELVRISRKGRNRPAQFTLRECTGAALSGGGIRSATFSLGIFQGLASLKMLPRIDFLSTVSGGGYFGSFYTRFFLRKEVPDFRFVQDTLTPCSSQRNPDQDRHYQHNVINWLRENGRYLSPRGSGDLLLAAAVLLRNWLVVQVVLATFFLLLFLSGQLLRMRMDGWFQKLDIFKPAYAEWVVNLPGDLKLWISPFVAVPIMLFVFGAVPLGWAYWLLGYESLKLPFWKRPATGVWFVIVVAVAIFLLLPDRRPLALGLIVITGLTAFWSCLNQAYSLHSPEARDPGTGAKYQESFSDDLARHLVSVQLKVALVLTAAALAYALVDSLGQTVYLVLLTPGATLLSWAGGVFGALVVIVPSASRIVISLRGNSRGKMPGGGAKFAAAAAAIVVTLLFFIAYSVAANAIAWSLQRPLNAPPKIGAKRATKLSDAQIVPNQDEPNNWSVEGAEPQQDADGATARNDRLLWESWGITLVLSLLFGQSWPFLNRSTQLPLYSARLIRAYLGASNPRRFKSKGNGQEYGGAAVTRVIPGDDIDVEYYWPWAAAVEEPDGGRQRKPPVAREEIYAKGTPLHLVNVTINETLDGKSQIQQQDRKGVGMALGPAGISAGIRHHLMFDYRTRQAVAFPRRGFRLFHHGHSKEVGKFMGEMLPLGQWLSISGAAFSTGLGARTNLALSLLTGICNIRLGYWWDSGIPPEKRPRNQRPRLGQRLGALFSRLFPVQSYLLDEYTARYHGTARRYWYLTDGGHFENMGGYELIRRRLRLIVIVDAEADPDYTFGGLSDLIRKARTDFGAEINFLEDEEVSTIMPLGFRHCFSSLENLRRGKWVEEHLPILNRKEAKRQTIDPVDHARFSLAHAALARVNYDCREEAESCLIYIKPTIVGDEPLDVLQYHVEHASFPQETTVDQFFDEAQWESYRRLGEHVAAEVFKAPEGETPDGWLERLVNRVLNQETADTVTVEDAAGMI